MQPTTPPQTAATRTQLTQKRGNFYYGLGFALLAGLLVVVGLGLLGITSLGVLSASTAFAMIAIAICLISGVSFVTLVTLRRTLSLLSHQERALNAQAARHADLAAKVQSQWQSAQIIRDRGQDAQLAALSVRPAPKSGGGRVAPLVGFRSGFRSPAARISPFGDIHPVRDIEGIGEHYGKLLDDMGIEDTQQLWNADADYVAGALQITPSAVAGWQCMAELMAINGIGKQYAELLVRSDVSSIRQLSVASPQPLVDRIQRLEKGRASRIQGNVIGIKMVNSWVHAAKTHHGTVPIVAVVRRNGRGA